MPVTRFAPSPTGLLHLGHAHSALFAAAAAGPAGTFLLRIEDIDPARSRPEFEVAILEDLAWLGLRWPQPVRRQSAHLDDYAAALARLEAKGVVYPCFCTRREIAAEIAAAPSAPHGPDGPHYPGTCRRLPLRERNRRLAEGRPHALRLDAAAAAAALPALDFREAGTPVRVDPGLNGDEVIAGKAVRTSYHLSVVVDDALQGVTLVTRGEDLLPATHLHRLLQALLDLPAPAYRHHRLLRDAAGHRLAKRTGAETIRAMRERGLDPAELRARAGFADSGFSPAGRRAAP